MISMNLKLLPVSENPSVLNSNEASEKSFNHLKNLIGGLKCKKHPSVRTIITVVAVENKDPKVEIANVCCQDFLKTISHR